MNDETKAALLERGKKITKKYGQPEPSELGSMAAVILSEAWDGIYHIEESALRKVDWASRHWVAVNVYGDFSTYDFSRLTQLVLLAHELCVRIELQSCAPRITKLAFSPRDRGDSIYSRHPTIEEAMQRFRLLPETSISDE